MRKVELRQDIRRLKRQFTPQQLEELSLPIISRLKPRLAEAHTILAYYSLPDEVYTHHLLDELVAEGKTVLLPKVIGEGQMEWHVYTSGSDLIRGSFGICEPEGDMFPERELPSSSEGIIAMVPGLAFDAAGHRLGRGKGYYDRFLATHPYIYKIGVCFDFQKVEEVQTDEYDVSVDEVI
ncbi:MAG: 5-formyltetrahydrofolate cyclo-ligase [Prevotella sp.]|nr:5-formyltetrahydrofolate cyclo-ligase [Prevotella sp.]